jgi:hypothetical protein
MTTKIKNKKLSCKDLKGFKHIPCKKKNQELS